MKIQNFDNQTKFSLQKTVAQLSNNRKTLDEISKFPVDTFDADDISDLEPDIAKSLEEQQKSLEEQQKTLEAEQQKNFFEKFGFGIEEEPQKAIDSDVVKSFKNLY